MKLAKLGDATSSGGTVTAHPSRGVVDLAWALLAAALPFAAFLWLERSYFSWGDEVQFVDPAARALLGQGFTSMAWPYQGAGEFFIGNAPGYSLLLVPWLGLLGFDLDHARWLNVLLAAGAGVLLWRGLRRVAPRLPAWLKAVAMLAVFDGAGVLLSLGSARYDALCMLVGAAIFHLFTQPREDLRPLAFVIAGAATFYAGFHLVAGLAVCMTLLALRDRAAYARPALWLGAGAAAGLLSWLALLATQGLLVKFFVITLGSQHTLSGQMAKMGSNALAVKLKAYALLPLIDPSFTLMAVAVIAMLLFARRSSPEAAPGARSGLPWLAIVLVVVMPLALLTLGKFPLYYTWMAYGPAVLIGAAWAQGARERGTVWPLMLFLAAAAASIATGVGQRVAQRDAPPGSQAYAGFQNWVRQGLLPSDVAFVDHEAYFAARSVADAVIAPTYGQTVMVPGIPERDAVTAIVVQATRRNAATALIGGRWTTATSFHVPASGDVRASRLDFVLLRRAPQEPGQQKPEHP